MDLATACPCGTSASLRHNLAHCSTSRQLAANTPLHKHNSNRWLSCSLAFISCVAIANTGMARGKATQHAQPPNALVSLASTATPTQPANVSSVSGARVNLTGGLNIPLRRPRIIGCLRNNKPIITELSGELAGGKIDLKGEINFAAPTGAQRASVQFENVSIASALQILNLAASESAQPLPPGPAADDACVSGTMNLHWVGMKPDAVQRSLEGTLSLQLADGTLSDAELLNRFGAALGLGHLTRVDLRSGRLDAVISAGKVQIITQQIQGPQLDLSLTGEYDLLTRALDLRCDLRLSPSLLSTASGPLSLATLVLPRTQEFAANFMPTSDDKLALPQIRISGTVDNPTIHLAGEELRAATYVQPDPGKVATTDQPRGTERVLAGMQ